MTDEIECVCVPYPSEVPPVSVKERVSTGSL